MPTRRALTDKMKRMRARGHAVDDEEFAPGIRCMARPIYDDTDAMVAAIAVSHPSVRLTGARLRELGRTVAAAGTGTLTGKAAS